MEIANHRDHGATVREYLEGKTAKSPKIQAIGFLGRRV